MLRALRADRLISSAENISSCSLVTNWKTFDTKLSHTQAEGLSRTQDQHCGTTFLDDLLALMFRTGLDVEGMRIILLCVGVLLLAVEHVGG